MSDLLDTIDVDNAIAKLTRPWTDVLSPRETNLNTYTPIDHAPLLDMLDAICRSSYGAGVAGASSDPASRNLLNLEAHALREHIDGTVRAWLGELSKHRAESELKAAIVQLGGILNAHHAAATITDREYQRITGFFPRWCERIWRLFDPPTIKELEGSCPNLDCEMTRWADGAGATGTALIAFYVKGTMDVRASCRSCGWGWVGPAQLAVLGRHLGAEQDEDMLRAAGL